MFANNEIGTIQPIKEIGRIAHEKNIYFHTDAVQALGNVKINVDDLNIDLMSMSAHKIYGPKGVGALYLRKGIKIYSLIHGGAQEKRRRAGTENIPGIVGFGKAAELAEQNFSEHIQHQSRLRDKLVNGILEKVDYVRINGHPEKRLPGTINLAFEFIEGESLLLSLDMVGICASSGSACTSGSLDPSHVLMAIGLPHEIAHGSLRITIGDFTTEEDIDYVLEHIPKIVKRLRDMSPLYEKVKGGRK
jgi:cysteine desulfurase